MYKHLKQSEMNCMRFQIYLSNAYRKKDSKLLIFIAKSKRLTSFGVKFKVLLWSRSAQICFFYRLKVLENNKYGYCLNHISLESGQGNLRYCL